LEAKVVKIFPGDKLPLVQFSAQNRDRFVTVYKACVRTGRTLVIDPYTCYALDVYRHVSKSIPQFDWDNIRVYFAPNSITAKLAKTKILYKYKSKKISPKEIIATPQKYVVKGNFMINGKILKAIAKENLVIIHSMWKGYIERPNYALGDHTDITVCIHTSGHAHVEDLQKFVEKTNPKNIIPIHTQHKGKYAGLFKANVIVLDDAEALKL
jgi:ribonuclease J